MLLVKTSGMWHLFIYNIGVWTCLIAGEGDETIKAFYFFIEFA